MSVAIDAANTVDVHTTGATTLTNSNLTVGSGSNRILLAGIVFSTTLPTITAFQWDAAGTPQNLTLVTSYSTSTLSGAIYALIAPTSGNKQLKVTWTGTAEAALCCASYTGAVQTSVAAACLHAVTNSGSSTAPSVTVTSATGDIVFGIFNDLTSPWTTTTGTSIMNDTAMANQNGAAAYVAGAASTTLTYNCSPTNAWRSAGVDIVAAGAATNPIVPIDMSDGPFRVPHVTPDASQSVNQDLMPAPTDTTLMGQGWC